MVVIPKGWDYEVASGGRGVVVPPDGKAIAGRDGRLIAIPDGWIYKEGKDGRIAAIPPDGTMETGDDERIIAVPKGWVSVMGGGISVWWPFLRAENLL